jgi:gamma-glutamylputrescine oxidase
VLGTGQRKGQDDLEFWLGMDDARKMWQIACDANQLVRDRVAEFHIGCDLKDGELSLAHREKHEQSLWDYAEHLEKNYDYTAKRIITRDQAADMLGVDTLYGGYLDACAGHVHPLNLTIGLARAASSLGANIYEETLATGIQQQNDGATITTATGDVQAKFVLIACNGYLNGFHKTPDWYQMPINNFILATEPLGEARGRQINRDDVAVVDTRFVVNYFHNTPDHRLIFGGGENYSPYFPRDIKAFVRKNMLKIYPNLADVKIDYGWGGTLPLPCDECRTLVATVTISAGRKDIPVTVLPWLTWEERWLPMRSWDRPNDLTCSPILPTFHSLAVVRSAGLGSSPE